MSITARSSNYISNQFITVNIRMNNYLHNWNEEKC